MDKISSQVLNVIVIIKLLLLILVKVNLYNIKITKYVLWNKMLWVDDKSTESFKIMFREIEYFLTHVFCCNDSDKSKINKKNLI